jgi:hypothetical protein
MAKGKSRKKPVEICSPTAEQMKAGQFQVGDIVDREGGRSMTIGKAYRRVPMIDTLRAMFSEPEWKALHHYRHHAMVADKSPVRDSLCIQRQGGSGGGTTVEMLNAVRVTADCERAAGQLVDILRAVVIEDLSLSEWAMRQAGGLDVRREKKDQAGNVLRVTTTIEPRRKALEIAQLEIKMVAKRVEAELAA